MKNPILSLIAASLALPAMISHGGTLVTDGSTVGGTTVSANLASHTSGGSVTTSINGSGNLVFAPNASPPNNDFYVSFNSLGLDTSVIKFAQIDFVTSSPGAGTGPSEMFHTDSNSTIGGGSNSAQPLGSPAVTAGGPFSIVVDLEAGQPVGGSGPGWGPGTSNDVRFDLFQATGNRGETYEISALTFGSQLIPESATLDGYSESPATYAIGAPIEDNLPIVRFGEATGFSVTPALPDGLQLDALVGTISGTPTALTAATDYTITASFDGVPDSSFDLNIEVTNPFIAGYSQSPAQYRPGDDIGANNPALAGAAPNLFSIDPPVPAGLEFDPANGVITGTPTGLQPATDHTITASYDGFPDSQFTLSIAIVASPTLVVDPAQPISNFTPLGEFNTDGDTEGWASNNADIAAAGGLLVVNTTAGDPQVFEGGLALDTSTGEHTVLEFRLRQTDNVFVEFFWGDANGGLSAARRLGIEAVDIPADGEFHVYQIDMGGVFSGEVNIIRLDPGPAGGRTVEFDYIRLGDFTAAEPPRFTDITYDTDLDEATVTWTSSPGESFILEASTDAVTWEEIDDSFPAAPAPNETTSFLDVDSISFPRRFYRVTRVEE